MPERREELTTEGGLDAVHHRESLKKYLQNIHDADIGVSLFIDPDLDQVRTAHRLEVDAVELHTGKYCDARGDSDRKSELQRLADAATAATKLGMRVAAGHGLNYHNIHALAGIHEISEFNVGHSIVARAIFTGIERAVREMVELL